MEAFNKDTRIEPSKLFESQLRVLVDRLKQKQQAGELYSIENVLSEASNILSTFSAKIGKPLTEVQTVLPNSMPDVDSYNSNVKSVLDDLEVLFEETDGLENSVMSSFNYVISEAERISKEIRKINSMLTDYIIYTGNINAGITYFIDSFNDLSYVDSDARLIVTNKANIDEAEGIATLAIDTEAESIKNVKEISINDSSNGVSGNNQQINASLNSEIDKVLDSNPDTWFEYEAVRSVNNPLKEELSLDIVIELDKIEVINGLVIDPNNFGTKHPIHIRLIETSLDGKTWKDLRQDIESVSFLEEEETDAYELSPRSSKFKGKGIFSFFPRHVKYLHITFQQDEYYLIDTSSGQKLRYAIGIKDIEIHGKKYLAESEFVSTRYYAPSEIKKVSLQTSQDLEDESLGKITHLISPDDGITWQEIQPRNIQVTGKTEIINMNTIDDNSISTNTPVNFVRYKAQMTRDSEAFATGTSVLSETRAKSSEIFNLSDRSPITLTLAYTPLSNTVVVLDPLYGSAGNNSYKYLAGLSSGEPGQQFKVPWSNFERDSERVWVGKALWSRVASLAGSGAIARVYALNYETGEIFFGDDTNGKVPESNSNIEVNFDPDSIWVSHGRVADLKFTTDGDKSNVTVNRIDADENVYSEVLVKSATIHRLANRYIVDSSEIFQEDAPLAFITKQAYVDGSSELTSPGDFSINYEEGLLYTYTPTDTSELSSMSYMYTPKVTLSEDQWDFYSSTTDDTLKGEIQISEDAHVTIPVTDEAITDSIKVTLLANVGVYPGTLVVSETIGADRFLEEVPFVDGVQELSVLHPVSDENVPVAQNSFTLNAMSSASAILGNPKPIFTEPTPTAFITEVVSGPTLPGEYAINYSTGIVTCVTATIADSFVNYNYLSSLDDFSGKYSVDYKNGRIYSFDEVFAGTTVSYDYSNYEVIYNIARVIPDDKYVIKALDKSIIIHDNEVVLNIVKSRETAFKTIVKVLYDYIDKQVGTLSELEPYYTPVIRGYALSIVDINNLT